MIQKEIKTERLALTGICKEDADEIFELHNDPEVYSQYDKNPIDEDIDQFIEMLNDPNHYSWAIRLKKVPERIIGICSLHDRDKIRNTIEIGGSLFPSFWRKGIMYEAFSAIMKYAFEELKVDAIECKTLVRNKGAIMLVEKLGFIMGKIDNREITMICIRNQSYPETA